MRCSSCASQLLACMQKRLPLQLPPCQFPRSKRSYKYVLTFRRDLTRSTPFTRFPGQLDANLFYHVTGMPARPRPQRPQARDLSPNLNPNIPHLRGPLPRLSSRQRPPSNPLHLRPTELPARAMSAEHRPLELVCHGRVRGRGLAG